MMIKPDGAGSTNIGPSLARVEAASATAATGIVRGDFSADPQRTARRTLDAPRSALAGVAFFFGAAVS